MLPIVFFGTHQFAAIILEAVFKSGLFDIREVVTMPDRPAGRHQEIQKTAVKLIAEKFGLKVNQPPTLKNYILLPDIEMNIVVDYGLIIPQIIVDTPRLGSINIHPSLLPKYRGASPLQSALINGESETGITIMKIDDKMDHGPILIQENCLINPHETYPELYLRIAKQAADLLIRFVPDYITGKIVGCTQDEEKATFTKIFSREDGKIDFIDKTAQEIYNLYRGLTPWPGIFTFWNDKRLKLIKIILADKKIGVGEIKAEGGKLFVGCKKGSLEILELQEEGKKINSATAFINGNRL